MLLSFSFPVLGSSKLPGYTSRCFSGEDLQFQSISSYCLTSAGCGKWVPVVMLIYSTSNEISSAPWKVNPHAIQTGACCNICSVTCSD